MNKIKLLEIKKLLKELDYIESDFEYRNEIISEADTEFINRVNTILNSYPELKVLYDEKIDIQIEQHIKDKTIESIESMVDETEDSEIINEAFDMITLSRDKSPKMKKLYRDIVKITHPDKSDRKSLNEFYIKATEYYDNDNLIGIYKICNELDIDYELDDEDSQVIESKIVNLKERINFLESTFTWKWIKSNTEKEKNEMLIDFIRMRIK